MPGSQGAGPASADDGAKAKLSALGDNEVEAGQVAVEGRVHLHACLGLEEGEVAALAGAARHEEGSLAGGELEQGRNQAERGRLHGHHRKLELIGQKRGRAPAGDDHVGKAAGCQIPCQGKGFLQGCDMRFQRQTSRRGQGFEAPAKLGA